MDFGDFESVFFTGKIAGNQWFSLLALTVIFMDFNDSGLEFLIILIMTWLQRLCLTLSGLGLQAL